MAPNLPLGAPTVLDSLSDTFSFHACPETYIASRVASFQAQEDVINSRAAIHVKILNRNVAVISSHAQIRHILEAAHDEKPQVVATAAYRQFMAAFFPSPNLLLSDGPPHHAMKANWIPQVESIQEDATRIASNMTRSHFARLVDSSVDIYESLKHLSWRILLKLFLDLDETDGLFKEVESLQEDLLRGQFSLFPVSLNVGLWQSPRSRGLAAKEKLERLIAQQAKSCPFQDSADLHLVNHVLMSTSSLAVKGMASLLTALLLNLFLFDRGGVRLVDEVTALQGEDRTAILRSVELETERLSPPVVGIMRRVTQDLTLPVQDGEDVSIPQGWDAWLYFVGAGRDAGAYGDTAGQFVPERFMSSCPPSVAFSIGGKTCLGQSLVRDICLAVAGTMLEDKIGIEGTLERGGVRAWLGWEEGVDVEEWARDMKQLPTQRPARAVKMRIVRS